MKKPLIPEQRYSVLEFGAEPDSSRIQTEAFQLAIDRVSEAGGGKICVPAGKYLTGAITLKSQGGASSGESGYLDSVCK